MPTENQYFGTTKQGFVPVRMDPHERAEMTTQLLFGEIAQILDDEGKWLYIRLLYDNYEGWVDKKSIILTNQNADNINHICYNNVRIENLSKKIEYLLPMGSLLPGLIDETFSIEGEKFRVIQSEQIGMPGSIDLTKLVQNVIGIPYIWGGRCGFGFDCSGLIQFICRCTGKNLHRDTSEQSAIGSTVNFINETVPGDLAFFDDTEGLIHHVGMIISKNQILHASGCVRIDKIDHQGIYNEEIQQYTHKLRVLKRICN